MTLSVWSGVAQVTASVLGAGRIEFYAVRSAGEPSARILAEAYDGKGLVAAGEVVVWELNQALATLLADSTQARRLALRDDGRGHGGYLDVVRAEGVDLVVTSRDGLRRVAFRTTVEALSADLNNVLRHYLALTRLTPAPRTVVLPDVVPAQPERARAALIRPLP